MMTFFVISKEQFEKLLEVKKFDIVTGQRKRMKERIVDGIKNIVKMNWFRMKKVLIVIDEIVYKLTDRGFSFNGRETLAEKCKVSLSTVDKAIRYLKESNLFFVAYRENSKSNGVKTPIFFYKNHQLFKEYEAILNLQEKNVENKVEKAETPSDSKDEQQEKIPTYSIPNSFKPNNTKRIEKVSLDKSFVSDYVPKEFVNVVGCFFDEAKTIEEYWKMVRISNYYTEYDKDDILSLAIDSFKQMIAKLKKGKVRKNPFAYFYGILHKKMDELYFEQMEEVFEKVEGELEFSLEDIGYQY